jgi:hypothetical protein
MMKAYKEGFERIRAESKTFTEIDTSLLALPDATRERWLLEQDGRSLERGLAMRAYEPGARPEEVKRQAIVTAYQRMNATKGKRMKGAQKFNGMATKPAFGFVDMFRRMWEAIQHAFVKPASEAWDEASIAPKPAPMGLRIRERR